MSADFRKVRPGQPLRITAKAWNRVLDTVSTRPEFGGGEGAYGRINHVVQIQNTTESTVPKWGVLSITGVLNNPSSGAASLAQYQDTPILEGGSPAGQATGKYVVAVEPIAAGKVGRAAIDGVVQLKVADLGKATGSQVLWKDSTWALIRIQAGIVRGTFTGTWAKGSTATVTDAVVSGATYAAKNYIATISGSVCLIAYVADEWVLVGWDWHSMTGYSASKQQVLTHAANGGLAWIDTTVCT